jgi:glycosyltransferase involved in cell wall biosynthesis
VTKATGSDPFQPWPGTGLLASMTLAEKPVRTSPESATQPAAASLNSVPTLECLRGIRLGFVSGRQYFSGDGVWADAGLGRLLDALRPMVGNLTLALCPEAEKLPLLDHRMSATVDEVLPLPELPSIARGFGKIASCRRVIREVERRSDVLIVQLPFAATLALRGARLPRVYHVCADIWAFAKRSSRFSGWKRLPALAAGALIDRLQARLFRQPDVRVVTNGAALGAHYGHPPGRAVVSSTIRDQDILSVARRRPADAPFRVLYVGYLRHEKGTDVLVEAFGRVLDSLGDAELEVVGARDAASQGMAGGIEEALAALGRKGTVRFLGHRNFGPELFQCFADADVLAVPSRTEGTPRVLVEARAFGCPVIGSAVGGIPTSISDGVDGLLVPSEDPQALADAILRVARDGQLRQRLIAGGLQRARCSTVEAFAAALAEEVAALVANSAIR